MLKHEFGIIQSEPIYNQIFDEYEPNRYNCISIEDELIESILIELQNIECYWYTIKNRANELAYSGITIISLKSIDEFIKILCSKNKVKYESLICLLIKAKENNKYIIHFGI